MLKFRECEFEACKWSTALERYVVVRTSTRLGVNIKQISKLPLKCSWFATD